MFSKQIIRIAKKNSIFEWFINQVRIQKRIQFVAHVLPKKGIGAELGVYKGQFSPLLLKHTEATQLHLIDPWFLLTARWQWAGGNQSTVDALIKILRAFKKEIEKQRVFVHVGDDLKVLLTFPDRYFDWVYIDSSHSYEHTIKELQLLTSKVKHDGVIAGDDWQPELSHRHHGVYRAVNEFVESENYRIIYSNKENLQWAIKRNKQKL